MSEFYHLNPHTNKHEAWSALPSVISHVYWYGGKTPNPIKTLVGFDRIANVLFKIREKGREKMGLAELPFRFV